MLQALFSLIYLMTWRSFKEKIQQFQYSDFLSTFIQSPLFTTFTVKSLKLSIPQLTFSIIFSSSNFPPIIIVTVSLETEQLIFIPSSLLQSISIMSSLVTIKVAFKCMYRGSTLMYTYCFPFFTNAKLQVVSLYPQVQRQSLTIFLQNFSNLFLSCFFSYYVGSYVNLQTQLYTVFKAYYIDDEMRFEIQSCTFCLTCIVFAFTNSTFFQEQSITEDAVVLEVQIVFIERLTALQQPGRQFFRLMLTDSIMLRKYIKYYELNKYQAPFKLV